MITLILKSYFAILLSVGIGSLFCFVLGLYLIFKPYRKSRRNSSAENTLDSRNEPANSNKMIVTSHDISAIAGDDVIATQLDLARAYIETGRTLLAKKILEYVRDHGSQPQQDEANRLLNFV